ncbi:MAG: hypothetical protein RI973_1145, partial [Bacteroidota bacterium]
PAPAEQIAEPLGTAIAKTPQHLTYKSHLMSLTTASSHYQVICFGEVLWDLLPTGKIAGGAPMNVAFHANNLGLKAGMISRVGKDAHGSELLAFFHEKGIPTGLIQQDEELPTGIVNVSLDERGSPSYEIVAPASWDNIQPAEAARQAVQQAGVLVFGSLACRSPRTRDTLLDLLVRPGSACSMST